jgi:hypothetical protein
VIFAVANSADIGADSSLRRDIGMEGLLRSCLIATFSYSQSICSKFTVTDSAAPEKSRSAKFRRVILPLRSTRIGAASRRSNRRPSGSYLMGGCSFRVVGMRTFRAIGKFYSDDRGTRPALMSGLQRRESLIGGADLFPNRPSLREKDCRFAFLRSPKYRPKKIQRHPT